MRTLLRLLTAQIGTEAAARECLLSGSLLEDRQAQRGDQHRIKADAPVLRPDEPVPANRVL